MFFITHILKSNKIIENLRKNQERKTDILPLMNIITFDDKTNYNGDALCTLDLKAILVGDKVVIMKNCAHIYHYNCMIKRYEKDKTYECPECNQECQVLNHNRT